MAEWIALTDFVDNVVYRASDLRPLISNSEFLHVRNADESFSFEKDEAGVQNSTSGILAKVTGDKYELEIGTSGGDVLLEAGLYCNFGTTPTTHKSGWALAVDGDFYNDITTTQENHMREHLHQYEQPQGLIWIVQGLAAGVHTFELYYSRVAGSSTLRLEKARRDFFWGVEL